MNYPVFEGTEEELELAFSHSVNALLDHAASLGLEVQNSDLGHYINNLASVLYDHQEEKYINSARGTVALLQKAHAKVKDSKESLKLILDKGQELYTGPDQENIPNIGIHLLSFINQKTKAFSPKEGAALIKELQKWLNELEKKKAEKEQEKK